MSKEMSDYENGDHSIREHHHKQVFQFRFQSTPYAPIPTVKGGSGKGRFMVEPMLYISNVGWDIVDIFNSGNEFALGVVKYVHMKETLYGYEHVGLSSWEMWEKLKKIWGKEKLKEMEPRFYEQMEGQ